jgi:hypothetical protein
MTNEHIKVFRLSAVKNPKVYHAIDTRNRTTLCGKKIRANDWFVMAQPANRMYRGETITCAKCVCEIENMAIQNCTGPDENGVW